MGLFGITYTEEEKQFLAHLVQTIIAMGTPNNQAKSMSKMLLDESIRESEKKGLRGIANLGDIYIKDDDCVRKRLAVGLKKEDILKYLNRNFVWIIAEDKLTNTMRFSLWKNLVEKEKKSPEEATLILRKSYIYCGDPEKSHEQFQGEDADIYPEFSARYESWRIKFTPQQEHELAQKYSTYNAMVRDLIRRGEL